MQMVAMQVHTLGGNHTFELPKSSVKLSQVFRTLIFAKDPLGIDDWGVTNATLEQVFQSVIAGQMVTGG